MIPAYDPEHDYVQTVKPVRGRKAPLKAAVKLLMLFFYFAAGCTILTLHTWRFYDATHILGWTSYTVQAGDTISGIAQQFDSQDFQPTVIKQIEKKNGLDGSSTIQSGQVLQVPVVGK